MTLASSPWLLILSVSTGGAEAPDQMQATLVRLAIPSMNLLILYVVIVTSRIQMSLRRSLPLVHSFSAASDDITLLLSSQVLSVSCLFAGFCNNTWVRGQNRRLGCEIVLGCSHKLTFVI